MLRWILSALKHLWFNEDGFFGIGQGPSGDELSQFGQLGNLASFASGEGEGDVATADAFWKSILSGDPSQISKVLGPEISSINKQSQQSKKTASEFGNRGGGTNSFMQQTGDTERSSVNSLIAGLVGQGATALGSTGSSLLGTGASAHEAAFNEANTIQQQRAARIGDIFKSITATAGAVFGGYGLTEPITADNSQQGGGSGSQDNGGPLGGFFDSYGNEIFPPFGGDSSQ